MWLERLERDQRRLELVRISPERGEQHVLVRETDPAWVNDPGAPCFLPGGGFVWISERDGWRQAYLYDSSGKLQRRLTRGRWEVREVRGLAAGGSARRTVLLSANRRDPRQRELLAVELDGGSITSLTAEASTHTIRLAPGGRYYLDTFHPIATPPRLSTPAPDGGRRRVGSCGWWSCWRSWFLSRCGPTAAKGNGIRSRRPRRGPDRPPRPLRRPPRRRRNRRRRPLSRGSRRASPSAGMIATGWSA